MSGFCRKLPYMDSRAVLVPGPYDLMSDLGGRSPLRPTKEVPSCFEAASVVEWLRLHVGLTGRRGRSHKFTTTHRASWVWLDEVLAADTMYQRRQRGTTVLWLTTWVPVRRVGRQMVVGPSSQSVISTFYWLSDVDSLRPYLASAFFASAPGPEYVRRLHDTNSNKWRYPPTDARAWKAVHLNELWGERGEKATAPREPSRLIFEQLELQFPESS